MDPIDQADLLLHYLDCLGVKYVFGIPGGAIEPLYDALARSMRKGACEPVVARHECGAAFMADGYARNSGKIGVCCSTTGPGATNLVTGVASARENNIPLLVITAQTALESFGHGAFQESADTGIDTVSMMASCTVFNTLVSHPDQFEQKLVSALSIAISKRAPVHLSVPTNVFKSSAAQRSCFDINALLPLSQTLDMKALQSFYSSLRASKKMVFVLGGQSYVAAARVMQVADFFNARVVCTPEGKACVAAQHPRFDGVFGFAGHERAYHVLTDPEVDTVVAIGTNLGEWSSNGRDSKLGERLIYVCGNNNDMSRVPPAKLYVRGDLFTVFTQIVGLAMADQQAGLKPLNQPAEASLKTHASEDDSSQDQAFVASPDAAIHPRWLMEQFPQWVPAGTKYFADTGNSMAWAVHHLHPVDRRLKERRTQSRDEHANDYNGSGRRKNIASLLQVTVEFASMGWAISAAIGAAMAQPNQPVVCFTGDGSVLMSGQEITVAQQYNLPILFVVFNDSSLGMVNHGQRLTGAEQVGTALPEVDFAMLAKALGVPSKKASSAKELEALKLQKWNFDGPLVLDLRIDAEAVPPIGLRTNVIKDALIF